MSVETIGSSVYWRIPSRSPLSAFERKSSLTASTLVSRRDLHDEVDDRAGRNRCPHRHPVDLALELRNDDADRARRAGRRRDQVDRSRTGAPQVLVRQVERPLVVRVRVDRRHEAVLDRERLVEQLRDGRDAVRRARRVGDDVVLLRVVVAAVDAEHERDVRVGRRGRDDDLLRAGLEMLLRRRAVGEEAGRLDRDVDAEVAPRQLRGIAIETN